MIGQNPEPKTISKPIRTTIIAFLFCAAAEMFKLSPVWWHGRISEPVFTGLFARLTAVLFVIRAVLDWCQYHIYVRSLGSRDYQGADHDVT